MNLQEAGIKNSVFLTEGINYRQECGFKTIKAVSESDSFKRALSALERLPVWVAGV